MTTYVIEMIAAHRGGRRHPTQDGRSLRRARREVREGAGVEGRGDEVRLIR